MKGLTIELEQQELRSLFENLTKNDAISRDEVIKQMHMTFGKEIFEPAMDRIKTFVDAYNELDRIASSEGFNHPYCVAYDKAKIDEYIDKDVIAYLKLRIICAALNEGWEPDCITDEDKYYPYFTLYSKEEYEGSDQEEKVDMFSYSDVYISVCAVKVSALSDSAPMAMATAPIGTCLYFKTSDLAKYAGKQFFDIYKDFCFKDFDF